VMYDHIFETTHHASWIQKKEKGKQKIQKVQSSRTKHIHMCERGTERKNISKVMWCRGERKTIARTLVVANS
jgi:hypothetical protein